MQRRQLCVQGNECVGITNGEAVTEAFAEILSRALPSLYRRAYRFLGNTADAEDAVQDALLAAYTHLDQFRAKSRMSTWITAIVHNTARMQLRTQHRHVHVLLENRLGEVEEQPLCERLADHRPSPEDECSNSELSKRLTRFCLQLSPTLRRAFQLRDIDGLSIRETAHILGVPSGTVKAQSARARKKVVELMRESLKRRRRTHTGSASCRDAESGTINATSANRDRLAWKAEKRK